MTLASGGSPIFPLVVHQPASPSIWPAVQSLRRGLSTNPGPTMWCVCGCVYGCVCGILLFPLVARCLETIYICIWRMFVFMSVVVTVGGLWECLLCSGRC